MSVEADRIASMQPTSIDRLPSISSRVVIGFEKDSNHPVEISPEDLYRHIIVIGPTGRGKTTLLAGLIEQLVSKNLVDIFTIDFKGDFNSIFTEKPIKCPYTT